MEYAVHTKDITKRFGALNAVDRLSLLVRTGEIYGLLGPNGAGKTTAIRMCCGLLKPSSGSILLLDRRAGRAANPLVGYMPQETALYLNLTISQNIRFFGRIHGLRRREIREREAELLELVDLAKWRNKLVAKLSGGMKHRVSLACALVHRPRLLFLDEPTVGVDPVLRVSFWDFFAKLRSDGVTVLITTHYMDEARRCDRVGFLRNGRLMAEGTPSGLLAQTAADSLDDAYLAFARKEAP